MSSLGRFAALAALALGVFLGIGCGGTAIDSTKTEGAIKENLEKSVGQKVSSVECPSGVEVKAGTTFDCTVSLKNGKTETATLKILNSDADVEVTSLKSDSGK